jgi:REP element-mobilizing transposase RayT
MMPEHIHLLLSEPVLSVPVLSVPEVGTPATVMQVLKQRSARALLPKNKPCDPRPIKLFGEISERAPFWQTRFYDFNVRTEKKRVEKLRYMHRNPVKRRPGGGARGLALEELSLLSSRRSWAGAGE